MKRTLLIFLTTVSSIIFIAWIVVRIVAAYQFNVGIDGHLKRASNANTIELAQVEIETSLKAIEKKELTSGNTGIIFKTPSNDVDFWYKNIKASYEELKSVEKSATQLEKTNLLMKLRESLTNEDGVISPVGISIYPNNLLFALWGWLSFIALAFSGIWLVIEESTY